MTEDASYGGQATKGGIKRRGRGRPRKIAIEPELPNIIEEEEPVIQTIHEPEEIVSMNTGDVDLSNIQRKSKEPIPEPEVFQMGPQITDFVAQPMPMPYAPEGKPVITKAPDDSKKRQEILAKINRPAR